MEYCGPRGIPHWHFLGGPNVWTAHDRAAALSWMLRDRQRCSSCGTRKAEWDPAKGGHHQAYEPVITRCPGCAATERGRKELEQLEKAKQAPSGAKLELEPRAVVQDAGGAR